VGAQTSVAQRLPNWQRQFISYINGKYTFYLGEDRSSCAYSIDPSDIYPEGDTRFVTARVGRGTGTICKGVLEFAFFQADCQSMSFIGSSVIQREKSGYAVGIATKQNLLKGLISIQAEPLLKYLASS